jgi:hypothetical protein
MSMLHKSVPRMLAVSDSLQEGERQASESYCPPRLDLTNAKKYFCFSQTSYVVNEAVRLMMIGSCLPSKCDAVMLDHGSMSWKASEEPRPLLVYL